jgi:hypothetical protein
MTVVMAVAGLRPVAVVAFMTEVMAGAGLRPVAAVAFMTVVMAVAGLRPVAAVAFMTVVMAVAGLRPVAVVAIRMSMFVPARTFSAYPQSADPAFIGRGPEMAPVQYLKPLFGLKVVPSFV